MAGKVASSQSIDSFELIEGDLEHPKTVASTSDKITAWIDPNALKLTHRIGRGPFGDVWLATHQQSTADYNECHEVAVKMLYPVKEDQVGIFFAKFEDVFYKCRGLQGVCILHGISIINGKICIVMKFYEGSVGDKMACFKGSKLSVPDVLRYGIDLAQSLIELHSNGILVLNLKPFNFLLNEQDQAILGDFGIPTLLLGVSFPSSNIALRLGTPNYMAPEQWQPNIRGPISFESDSWGFGCSVVEMLSGMRPWCGRSPDEIYELVIRKHEKPTIPSGLPRAVENVLSGCFEYDLRDRPLMAHILYAFKSCQSSISGDNGWIGLGSSIKQLNSISGNDAYTEWFLSKDLLQVGDSVRSRKPPNSCRPEIMYIPEGTVVGLDSEIFALVRVHGIHDPLRVLSTTLERVTFGFAAGDWVRVKAEDKKHSPVGILHAIDRDGRVTVGFIGLETLWKGNYSELQMAESYCVGQFVKLKPNVFNPRFEWPRKRGGEWATGRISQVLQNGCLLVRFPSRLVFGDERCFLVDPAEVEVVTFSTCPGVMKKYQHLEDFHWAVRPLMIALGLFTTLKLGLFIGKHVGRSKARTRTRKKGGIVLIHGEDQRQEGENASNSTWLPPSVANMLFREGGAIPR